MPHIHEKIDFIADVYVIYNSTVLLRKHDKYKKWFSVGGHVELDEDPNQAALREVKEEVGLDIELFCEKPLFDSKNPNFKHLIPPIFLDRHRINPNHEHIGMVYFATSKSNKIIEPDNEKSEGCKWFTMDELDSNTEIPPDVLFYAKEALRRVKK